MALNSRALEEEQVPRNGTKEGQGQGLGTGGQQEERLASMLRILLHTKNHTIIIIAWKNANIKRKTESYEPTLKEIKTKT